MPANNYYTIFELGLRSFPWARIIPPLVFLVGGLLLFRLFRGRTFYVAVGLFAASIASIILLTSLVVFVPKFVTLRSAYASGKGIVVEGIVQNFHPAPTIGPASESFSVQGISFSYNALDATPCFHNAPFHHGPIRDGLQVRIHYYDGCIQRIDAMEGK
jgi:hypothetical protein